jgi:cellulose synthase/poly-beta-1,6-N-acetylglucosamine synthase-like glycosyltransferase
MPQKIYKTIVLPELKTSDVVIIRILIVLAVLFTGIFLAWFFQPVHKGLSWLYWLLVISIGFKLLQAIHEWYHLFGIYKPKLPPKQIEKVWTVDMLTTYCPGEPIEMIEETLRAMVKITYPHTTYLCDEGNDPYLKKFCEELGVIHVTRTEKINAKAGNINNALKQATGELCVIMDPDHVPFPDFLDHVVHYFEDEEVGYVQVVQSYKNQGQSLVAKAAAEQTYQFYGPIMMAMGRYGTAQAIGANCTFRRTALDSIGGHAPGLTEDMHTSMLLHAKGWKSVYTPVVLSKGLVPNTLSAYYKQQIKWARGTFDMLFYVYPRLFKDFSWRQKIHYFTLPLYYLFGFVTLIDIIIPIVALTTAKQHWQIDFVEFGLFYTPVLVLTLFIRQFSQRWLLEKNERGFHVLGGVLRTATAWIYITGFVYTLLKVKVPYIPTPKDDKPRNEFLLSLPSLFVALISALAIAYGLSVDLNPYTILMSGFAFVNTVIFSLAFLMGHHRWGFSLREYISNLPWFEGYLRPSYHSVNRAKVQVYIALSRWAVAISFTGLLIVGAILWKKSEPAWIEEFPTGMPYSGPFLTGSAYVEANLAHNDVPANNAGSIIHLPDVAIGENLPLQTLSYLRSHGKYGFLHLVFTPKDLATDSLRIDLFSQINEGRFDSLMRLCARSLQNFPYPVFIEPTFQDATALKRLQTRHYEDRDDFKEAWSKIIYAFKRQGIEHVTWVAPLDTALINGGYIGGEAEVDWFHFKGAPKAAISQIKTQYEVLKETIKNSRVELVKKRPILLTLQRWDGEDEKELKKLVDDHDEIRAILYDIESHTKQLQVQKTLGEWFQEPGHQIGNPWYFAGSKTTSQVMQQANVLLSSFGSPVASSPVAAPVYAPVPSGSRLSDFPYIKGICYNPEHSWRDNHLPLTREQLQKDFARIQAMGANTLRRYAPGIYDYNILNVANEYQLKVIYGFWHDPRTDFIRDQAKVRKYFREMESKINEFKDRPAILAWAIGNETWGLLKKHYGKPYLTENRIAYVEMLEEMAQKIKQIDPDRLVMTAMEHLNYQTEGELWNYHQMAPSIDIVGINSYYEEQISRLDSMVTHFCPSKPYIVSEFGPKGYWDTQYTDLIFDNLMERSDASKARTYLHQWDNHIVAHKGRNLGGMAFCWRDRFEGTATWFGLTDKLNETKPAYDALKAAWTGQPDDNPFPEVNIIIPMTSDLTQQSARYVMQTSGELPEGATIVWELYRDKYMKKIDVLNIAEDQRSVEIIFNKIPRNAQNLRLYLYIRNGQGRVVTASAPVVFTYSERTL